MKIAIIIAIISTTIAEIFYITGALAIKVSTCTLFLGSIFLLVLIPLLNTALYFSFGKHIEELDELINYFEKLGK